MSNTKKTISTSKEELAARYQVTDRTIRNWLAAGVDVEDPEAVAAYRATLQRSPSALREKKLEADTREKEAKAELAEIQLAKVKGDLLSVSDLNETMVALGARVKAQLLTFEKTLPPILEGKTAPDMVLLIREQVERVLTELAAELDKAGAAE
jgi:hypothetical protein